MASRRSSVGQLDAEEKLGSRASSHDDVSHALPEGSALFQEVMAQLNPQPTPPSPVKSPPPRRRKSLPAKHVHYTTDGRTLEGIPKEGGPARSWEPDQHILHGKCHCYFVANGVVTGLADQQCQHQHRHHHSPPFSPRSPGKLIAPPPASSEGRSTHQTQSRSFPPQAGEFRSRSHSDTAVMARLSTSRVPRSSVMATSSQLINKPGSTSHGKGGRGSSERIAAGQRSPNAKRNLDGDLAQGVSHSLHISSPSSELAQEIARQDLLLDLDPVLGADEIRVRKLSSHTVSSDQLHYLYEQFLQHKTDVTSGQGTSTDAGGD